MRCIKKPALYKRVSRVPGGEKSYAYAKACGIIGKSFTGKRKRGLEKVNKLSELERIVFPGTSQSLPEKELLANLEKRVMDRTVKSIISILRSFSKPPEFLVLQIRSYEYADLFAAINSSREGERTAPPHTDLGPFQTVRFEAWPDIRKMIDGTEFVFLLDKDKTLDPARDLISLQNLLDRSYYGVLWNSMLVLPARERRISQKILFDEISLKNSSWALRLRTYYRMQEDEVRHHLIDIQPEKKRSGFPRASLANEALKSLEFPLDDFSAWSSWRQKKFLNPVLAGEHWYADPRYFQSAASRHLFHLAKHYFHLTPFSLDSVFCFIKMKQFEEDILTSFAEGLGVGLSYRETISVLGAEY